MSVEGRGAERTEWQEQVREHTRPFIVVGAALEVASGTAVLAAHMAAPIEHELPEPAGEGFGLVIAVAGLVSIWHGVRVRRTARGHRRRM